jgi:putative hemolysin
MLLVALLQVLVVLLLILANGVFAAAEMAVVSARRGRLMRYAKIGDERAGAALELMDSRPLFLSTVQIGITLVATLASAFGGASLAIELAEPLAEWPVVGAYAPALALGIVVLTITYFTLVLGELAPKRLALRRPERTTLVIANPMLRLCRLLAPVSRLLARSTSAVMTVVGQGGEAAVDLTAEDIADLVRRGAETGVIEHREQDIINRVLLLGDRQARNVMVPRTQMRALPASSAVGEAIELVAEHGSALIPVFDGTKDNVVGVVHARDLVGLEASDDTALTDLARPLLAVPETTSALQVLASLQRLGRRMALIVDEHGGTAGSVALEDVLEELVGELAGIQEVLAGDQIVERPDGSLLVDGRYDIVSLRSRLELAELPGEGEADFETLAGFVLRMLEHVPRAGEYFDYEGYRFEVVDMDGLRVDRVLISRLAAT